LTIPRSLTTGRGLFSIAIDYPQGV
jgi:hypothetical protein